MKVNFHNVGSQKSSFSINTHQLNSDILIRAVKRLGSVRSNAISIAYDEKNQILAVTAPRGNRITFWDTQRSLLIKEIELPQPSGIQYLVGRQQFIVSSAKGGLFSVSLTNSTPIISTLYTDNNTAWDNHLVIT